MSGTVPSLAPPPQAVPRPSEHLRPAPYNLSAAPRHRNMAQMKEQRETSELSTEEIASLSDGEFKALVIKMLTELSELGQKMKDTQNEIKQNIQGTNQEGNQDSKQQFETKGRNKHPTGSERRNKNPKK